MKQKKDMSTKPQLAIDTYEFQTHKPSYDEVSRKMDELEKQGWKKLEYIEGYKHIGRDPYDTDYTQKARIRGVRQASKSDFVYAIRKAKEDFRKLNREIADIKSERNKLDSEIKDYTKDAENIAKEIASLENDLEKMSR